MKSCHPEAATVNVSLGLALPHFHAACVFQSVCPCDSCCHVLLLFPWSFPPTWDPWHPLQSDCLSLLLPLIAPRLLLRIRSACCSACMSDACLSTSHQDVPRQTRASLFCPLICHPLSQNHALFFPHLPQPQSLLVFTARSYGGFCSWHWNSELGVLV